MDVRICYEEATISHTYEWTIQDKDSWYCKYLCFTNCVFFVVFFIVFLYCVNRKIRFFSSYQQKKAPEGAFFVCSWNPGCWLGISAFSFYGVPTRFNEVGRAEASVALMSAERSFCAIRLPNAYCLRRPATYAVTRNR